MNSTSFNLLDVIAVLQKQWKSICIFVLASLIVTIATLFIVPKYYRSTIVFLPASPALADKARIFNTNIQNLYSFLGNGDDNESLLGIAKLDTVFYTLIDEFKLIDYYKTDGDTYNIKRKRTIKLLQKDVEINKTEFNQLRIIVLTKNNFLSANIANRIVEIIQETEQNIWKEVYQNSLKKLNESVVDLNTQYQILSDSLSKKNNTLKSDLLETQRQLVLEQIKQYQKSVNELKLAIETTPPALYIIEKATPSVSRDKPIYLNVLMLVLLASFVFAIVATLIFERKKLDQ